MVDIMGAGLSNDPFVTFTKSWVTNPLQVCPGVGPARVDPQHCSQHSRPGASPRQATFLTPHPVPMCLGYMLDPQQNTEIQQDRNSLVPDNLVGKIYPLS